MESQPTSSGHLVLLCAPGWGHIRPLCALSAKVVKEQPDISITFLLVGDFRKRTEQEINRSVADSRAKGNIRIVQISSQTVDPIALIPPIIPEFPTYYDKLVHCRPVQCLETRRNFDALQKPTAVVLDFFLLPLLRYIRSVTEKSVPVYAWVTSSASSSLHIMGPETLGGIGDLASKARTRAEATGRDLGMFLTRSGLCYPLDGNLVNIPGLPTMYDYEFSPQELATDASLGEVFVAAYSFARECDGFLTVSSAAYEPKSLDAMRAWLRETNRQVYAIGPLVPPTSVDASPSDTAKQMEIDSLKGNGGELQAFLDKTLKSYGERSLIYISFGTFWWPARNEHAWILVDVLLELRFPFIFSHASSKAVIPPGYAEKIKQSGIGILSAWCPQQIILSHPATGWFLTHCGQNSVTESLMHGIPMIGWPLNADQPANAAHLTLNLDVAFEMVEGRTGPGLKPLYRGVQPTGTIDAITAEARSVLHRARRPEGERKRRNAEAMREKWEREWEDGGEALVNLKKFLTDNCPPI